MRQSKPPNSTGLTFNSLHLAKSNKKTTQYTLQEPKFCQIMPPAIQTTPKTKQNQMDPILRNKNQFQYINADQ